MDSNEAHNLSRLLYVILIAIKRTFKADKKLAGTCSQSHSPTPLLVYSLLSDLPCVAPLDNLVRLLKTVSFKLKWCFKATGPETTSNTDSNSTQLLDWATHAIEVATLIQLLIECCQPIEPQVQKRWADEALNWAIEYKVRARCPGRIAGGFFFVQFVALCEIELTHHASILAWVIFNYAVPTYPDLKQFFC